MKRVVSEVVELVGEASDGMAATEMIRRLRPDFIILDVDLDVLNGVEVCRRISQELPNSNVLVLTDSYHATKYHNQLMRAGARGFCLKSSGPRTLFEAIEQVTRALPYCDPKITQLVKQTPSNNMPNCNLTDREIEVLIRLDLRNKEISEELDMKLRTVEKHIECILAKLKVPTRTAAALKAVQLGYVLLPKMPGRDPVTGVSHEQTVAELQAELAIANEHLKALLKQNELLKEALNEKLRDPRPQSSAAPSSPDQTSIQGTLRKANESGNWLVATNGGIGTKYILMNVPPAKRQEPWFKEGTIVRVSGSLRENAATYEGTPLTVDRIEPL